MACSSPADSLPPRDKAGAARTRRSLRPLPPLVTEPRPRGVRLSTPGWRQSRDAPLSACAPRRARPRDPRLCPPDCTTNRGLGERQQPRGRAVRGPPRIHRPEIPSHTTTLWEGGWLRLLTGAHHGSMTTVTLPTTAKSSSRHAAAPTSPAAPPATALGRGQRNGPRAGRGIRPVTYLHPGPAAAAHPPFRSGRA